MRAMDPKATKSKFVPKHILESDFAKDYQSGMSKQEIAKKYCITATTVYRYASNLNIRRNSAIKHASNRKVTESKKDETCRSKGKGKTARKLTAEEKRMGYRMCKGCGEPFYVEYAEYWGWKVNYKSELRLVCSYTCMRAAEKRKRKTRLDIYGENAEYAF